MTIEQRREATFTLKAVLKDEYDLLLKIATGTTMYGIPLPELSKDDLMVAFAFQHRQTENEKKRSLDRLKFENELKEFQRQKADQS